MAAVVAPRLESVDAEVDVEARRVVVRPVRGSLLVVADAFARTLAAPLELPVGALLAAVGGPYFLALVWRRSL